MGRIYKEILSKSKMALNLNGKDVYDTHPIGLHSSGNGILTLWNKGEMKKVIPDNHALYFDTQEELCEKIIYFHTHDEVKISSLPHPLFCRTHYTIYHRNHISATVHR